MNRKMVGLLLAGMICLQPFAGCVQREASAPVSGKSEVTRAPDIKRAETVEAVIETPKDMAVPLAEPAKPETSAEPAIAAAAPKSAFDKPTVREKTFEELAPTVNMSFEELVGDNGNYEDLIAFPSPGTYRVIVDIYHQVVLVYEKDEQGAYTVPVRYMVCTTGSSKTPTPRGTFLADDHRVRFGLFVNDNVFGQYWTQITRRIYFHSLLYTQRNANSYTKTSYNNLGKRGSHGCVRLLVPDARWVYYHIAPGTEVEIRKGDKEDAATAAIKEKLTRPKVPSKRPGLKKGEIPHTDNWEIDTYLAQYTETVSAQAG